MTKGFFFACVYVFSPQQHTEMKHMLIKPKFCVSPQLDLSVTPRCLQRSSTKPGQFPFNSKQLPITQQEFDPPLLS